MSRGSSTAESRRRVVEMHVTEEARGLDLLPAKQGIVDGYMRSYANERRQFASFQYFAEKQLNEAFRMTEYDTLPSSFRTAVVVDLLGCLGQLFVRFESPFTGEKGSRWEGGVGGERRREGETRWCARLFTLGISPLYIHTD